MDIRSIHFASSAEVIFKQMHQRRRMHEELKACGDSPWLAGRAAASAGTALQLLAERAEYMAATGPEV